MTSTKVKKKNYTAKVSHMEGGSLGGKGENRRQLSHRTEGRELKKKGWEKRAVAPRIHK